MKVSIKELSVSMDIKNNGIEMDVYSNSGKHLGDLVVTKSKVTWCPGKTPSENGISLKWEKFIALIESQK